MAAKRSEPAVQAGLYSLWDGTGMVAARLAVCSLPYMGWGYESPPTGVAYRSGWLPPGLLVQGQGDIDCSTFTASVLMAMYPQAPWTEREYGDLQVFRDRLPDNPDSPIQAVERMCIGGSLTAETMEPGFWHLLQLWRRADFTGGHAVFAMRLTDGGYHTVESSSSCCGPVRRHRPADWLDGYWRVYAARLYR